MTVKPNTLAKRRWREKPENRLKEKLNRNTDREWIVLNRKRATPEGWAKHTMLGIRHRAKKKGLQCDITYKDLVRLLPVNCPVLGFPLEFGHGKGCRGRAAPSSPSVDRFDSTKGYIKDNIRVISMRANILKSDATSEELAAVLKYMEGR